MISKPSTSNSSSSSRKRSKSNDSQNRRLTSPFPNFSSYMTEKNRKLSAQFDADAHNNKNGGIFSGVSIFVDGYTIPSSQELKAYMLNHGGRFENYFSMHRVTHIVCSNLPDSKMKNFRAFSHGLPVVRPAWVVDSIAANRLLNCDAYKLREHVHTAGKQQKLSDFFLQGSSDKTAFEAREDKIEKTDNFLHHSMLVHSDEISECKDYGSEMPICHQNQESSGATYMEPESSPENENNAMEETGSKSGTSANFSSHANYENPDNPCDGVHVGSSNHMHSTLTDPNFVENYFKSSRLHFIGTWRNRYRKRFSDFLTEAKSTSSKKKCQSDMQKAAVIHIDMDCFFVSVVIRNYPDFFDKPVAVCHSDNTRGTAEISSANYPARGYGIKAGMFVRDAKARCPHLVIFPYDFKAYEEVAEQFYSILHKHCNKVQALSCDEAYLDVTDCGHDPEEIASIVRREIAETTRCTASAGIAQNPLLARLATRSAKPNGQRFIPDDKVEDFLVDLPIKVLPGIGHATYEKLKKKEILTCGQMRIIPKEVLQKEFGVKIGDMLWDFCRGIDNRMVECVQETKSIGAEVNWGVRFNELKDCQQFLISLCKEVSLRLQGGGVQGRTITLKVKKRKKGAVEPVKFLGCGDCQTISRSITIPVATDDAVLLQNLSKQLFTSFQIDVREIRGVGLQITKLQTVDINRKGNDDKTLESWLTSSTEKIRPNNNISSTMRSNGEDILSVHGKLRSSSLDSRNHQDHANSNISNNSRETGSSFLPQLTDLDIEVVKNLPTEIIAEMNDIYHGELTDYIRQHDNDDTKHKTYFSDTLETTENLIVVPKYQGGIIADTCITGGDTSIEDMNLGSENKMMQPSPPNLSPDNYAIQKAGIGEQSAYSLKSSYPNLHSLSTIELRGSDIMPGSLSQADVSVLEQLPEDVKVDLLELLPTHRKVEYPQDAPSALIANSNKIEFQTSEISNSHLWSGCPPYWVDKFKSSNCLILNAIANLHSESNDNERLSATLLSLVSYPLLISEPNSQEDEALSGLYDLLDQFIHYKIGSDIEELYDCFCLLKRFSSTSNLFLQLYNRTLPIFQVSVKDFYGGNVSLSLIDDENNFSDMGVS